MSWWGKHRHDIGKVGTAAAIAAGGYFLAPAVAGMTTAQATLAAGGLTAAGTLYGTSRTNRANAEAIAAQNAYNAPAAQKARLVEAGLNPNLVYSSGNVVGNQSGAASYDYSGYGAAAQSALNNYLAVENHDMNMQLNQADLIRREMDNHLFNATMAAQISKLQYDDKIAAANARMAEAQARMAEHDADVASKTPNTLSKNSNSLYGVFNRFFAKPEYDVKTNKIIWR